MQKAQRLQDELNKCVEQRRAEEKRLLELHERSQKIAGDDAALYQRLQQPGLPDPDVAALRLLRSQLREEFGRVRANSDLASSNVIKLQAMEGTLKTQLDAAMRVAARPVAAVPAPVHRPIRQEIPRQAPPSRPRITDEQQQAQNLLQLQRLQNQITEQEALILLGILTPTQLAFVRQQIDQKRQVMVHLLAQIQAGRGPGQFSAPATQQSTLASVWQQYTQAASLPKQPVPQAPIIPGVTSERIDAIRDLAATLLSGYGRVPPIEAPPELLTAFDNMVPPVILEYPQTSICQLVQQVHAASAKQRAAMTPQRRRATSNQVEERVRSIEDKQTMSETEAMAFIVSTFRGDQAEELAETSNRISLVDPISLCRLTVPARTVFCQHVRCFDLIKFVELNWEREKPRCPICLAEAPEAALQIDSLFKRVLAETEPSTHSILFFHNGSWEPAPPTADEAGGGSQSEDDDDEALAAAAAPPTTTDYSANATTTPATTTTTTTAMTEAVGTHVGGGGESVAPSLPSPAAPPSGAGDALLAFLAAHTPAVSVPSPHANLNASPFSPGVALSSPGFSAAGAMDGAGGGPEAGGPRMGRKRRRGERDPMAATHAVDLISSDEDERGDVSKRARQDGVAGP